jgi:hypothetical protein
MAILLTLVVLAPPGCQGEKGPKPKTDTPAAYHYPLGPSLFRP